MSAGAAEIGSIDGLVLRKTPYSESSLVVAVLTPDEGQQHFMLKGERRPGKKRFPAADLFRHVRIGYRPSKRELHTAREIDCVTAYDAIAGTPLHYRTATWLCRLALRNTVAQVPAPDLFAALENAFCRLAGPQCNRAAIVLGVCFVLLDEAGLLPELPPAGAHARQLHGLVAFAMRPEAPPPDYAAANWDELGRWMKNFWRQVGLRLPTGGEQLGEFGL